MASNASYMSGLSKAYGARARNMKRIFESRHGPKPQVYAQNQLKGPMTYGRPSSRSTNERRPGALGSAIMTDPIQAQIEALMAMLTGGPQVASVDLANLRGQIEAQVNPVYNAQRSVIEGLMNRARTETAANQRSVKGLYGALAGQYKEEGVTAKKRGQQAAADTKKLYGDLKSNVAGEYSRIQQEQAAMMEQLGIQDVMGAVGPQMAEQQGEFMQDASTLGTAAEQFSQNMGTMDQEYYAQGAPLANLEGANRSADLGAMLQQYLSERSGEIGVLEGQRSSDIMTAFNQLAGSAQEAAGQAGQSQFDNLLKLLQFQQGRSEFGQRMSFDQQKLGAGGQASSGYQTGLQMAQQTGSQRVMNAYDEVLLSDVLRQGRQEVGGELVPVNPNTALAMAQEIAIRNKLSPAEASALKLAIAAAMG